MVTMRTLRCRCKIGRFVPSIHFALPETANRFTGIILLCANSCLRAGALPKATGVLWAAHGRSEPKFYRGLSPGRPHLERVRAYRVAGLSQREKGDSPHLGRASARAGEEAPEPAPNSTEAVAARLAAS